MAKGQDLPWVKYDIKASAMDTGSGISTSCLGVPRARASVPEVRYRIVEVVRNLRQEYYLHIFDSTLSALPSDRRVVS